MCLSQSVMLTVAVMIGSSSLVTAGDPINHDESLESAVQLALLEDFRLRDSTIRVQARSGHVTLRGSVATPLDKQRASRLSRRVAGVTGVFNRLHVDSAVAGRTEEVVAIEKCWRRDPVLRSFRLRAIERKGVIIMRGEVWDAYQKRHAERLALNVPGVRIVRNFVNIFTSTDVPVHSPF